MYKQLCVVVLIVFFTDISDTFAQGSAGNGTLYRLNATESVWLEGPYATNFSYLLLVGKHASFLKKCLLLRFEDIPSACMNVNHAAMYLYYYSSVKLGNIPSSVNNRTIQAHRVLKCWRETEASSLARNSVASWRQTYLELDNTDADTNPTGQIMINSSTPHGFVEIDVTSAVRSWRAGIPNYGLLIWATNEDIDGYDTRFYGRSFKTLSRRPYILINCN